MSPFWEGFFSVFGGNIKSLKKYEYKPFQWYHNGLWYEHPLYKRKKKK